MKKYNDVHISFTISRRHLPELLRIADKLNLSRGQVARRLVELALIRSEEQRAKEIERVKEIAKTRWVRDYED